MVFRVAKYCTAFQQHHEIYCTVIPVWYQNFHYVVNTNIIMNRMSDDFIWLNVLVSLVIKNFNHNTGKLAEFYMFIKIFIHVFWGKMNKCQTIHALKTWFLFLVVLVAEVTQPSLGVGYEIGRAVALGKVIICLFRPDSGKSKILRTLLKNCHLNFRTLWIL